MKLRIRGNSIRLRLGRSEVARIVEEGVVEDCTTFDVAGRQRLEYVLCSAPDAPAVTATFDEGRVVVRVPAGMALEWGTTDRVGIDAVQTAPGGGVLKILIEKDLECIDAPAGESQEDAYRRPEPGAACPSTAAPANIVEYEQILENGHSTDAPARRHLDDGRVSWTRPRIRTRNRKGRP